MAGNSQSVLNRIGELFKNLFDGNGFEKDVINPSEESLNNLTQETETTEKGLLASVKEFIDENVTSKIGNLKEKGLEGLEGLKDRIFEGPDLEELSQNFLDAKENGETDQMARLSKQIVKINAEQEPQKYKEMSEEQMYNYSLSSGLASIDTETYRETLSKDELEKFDTILEAMGIASREKYLNNDFDTNGQLMSERLLSIKEEKSVGPNNYYQNFVDSMERVELKYNAAKNPESVNLDLMERFERIDDTKISNQPSYGKVKDTFNSIGLDYLENVKNVDTTKAKEYLDKGYGDGHRLYTQVPEELFEQKEEQTVPWEGRNFDR